MECEFDEKPKLKRKIEFDLSIYIANVLFSIALAFLSGFFIFHDHLVFILLAIQLILTFRMYYTCKVLTKLD